ncbi:MAG: hypothetical protein JWN70_5925 [Planctomycetaceae bacterium]|nr:hypothetical protein [Planctomycetaceae bacterium]
MNLRPELLPPTLDEVLVTRLAELAAQVDGARAGEGDDWLAEFNSLAGTTIPFEEFQGIYGAEDHADWVRRVLTYQQIKPTSDVTREELVEIVRRAMPQNGYPDAEAYMAIFDVNVPRSGASNIIFYPPDYDSDTNTWGGGRMIGEYDPTPQQIVDWAFAPPAAKWEA